MAILPTSFDFDGPFPSQTRRLRLGVVGGGRISQTQAMAARMTDRWDIVAGAFSSDPAKAQRRGEEWNVAADRSYADFQAMAVTEAAREDGIDAVMITPRTTRIFRPRRPSSKPALMSSATSR